MSKRIIEQLVDDLDGTVLEAGAGESVDFSLDGKRYQIDLTEAHAEELRAALAPYIKASRLVFAPQSTPSARKGGGGKSPKELAAIREWANANGHSVSSRGRVPATVLDAYAAAH
ncbi:histone-like nucleoid-structuring protein Lsr2 [Agromyces seonyuensis]|uniref:Lsr2 family protein n=1 Tax=Agromyces seonyuensis TaxID=2662446 RepID=A0A6I4NWN2_9MICO|nr:Lsr2 family protein [Agromyces seonyuensis]MWB97492.1 Lsr2 family protein [Agromyces seonyuensis]